VILSRLLAARLLPGEDPLGKEIQPGHNVPWATVVGIAENVKNNGLTDQSDPEIYILRKNSEWGPRAPILIVNSIQSLESTAPWLRSQVMSIDATVPVKMEGLPENVGKLAERPRFEAALLSFFASCGLLLAVIGLYGVVSFTATQRTQETGIRMALGANRIDILRLIAGEGAQLIALGGAVGLISALGTAKFLKSLLFVVGPYDLSTYIAITLLLGSVAFLAIMIPARRAMKVEPATALRAD